MLTRTHALPPKRKYHPVQFSVYETDDGDMITATVWSNPDDDLHFTVVTGMNDLGCPAQLSQGIPANAKLIKVHKLVIR